MSQKVFYEQLVLVPAVSKRFMKHQNSSFPLSQGREMIVIIKTSSVIIKGSPGSMENPEIPIQTFRTGINLILPSDWLRKIVIVNWGTGIEKCYWSMKTTTFKQVPVSHAHTHTILTEYLHISISITAQRCWGISEISTCYHFFPQPHSHIYHYLTWLHLIWSSSDFRLCF